MLLCISGGVLDYFEYPSKHEKLHQGVDYIIHLRYYIFFDFIIIVSTV